MHLWNSVKTHCDNLTPLVKGRKKAKVDSTFLSENFHSVRNLPEISAQWKVTMVSKKVQSPSVCASKLNHDLTSISVWAKRLLVTMNESKTKSIVFSAKREKPLHPPLILNNSFIEDVTVHEHLGLTLSSNLSWRAHILKIH